jgi:pilus assembly protein Flp/PilA
MHPMLDAASEQPPQAPHGRSIMQNFTQRFVKDESGATAIEYGLIAALIAVGIITAAKTLGAQFSPTFNSIANTMKSA